MDVCKDEQERAAKGETTEALDRPLLAGCSEGKDLPLPV